MRVLIVDDSAAIRQRLTAILEEVPGVDVFEAVGADEALEVAPGRRPELVLLDLQMPRRNGLAILSQLKALSPPPVIVVMTNEATEHHRRMCTSRGADYFFDKSDDFAGVLLGLVRPTRNAT